MLRKWKENLSIFSVKHPSQTILLLILVLNFILFGASAAIISALAPRSLEHSGFWASVFYTISMIFDAGCIQFVIEDIGEASVALIIVCIVTVLLGMITFTGAVIGYVTNVISNFIENSKSGARALKASGHTIVLNWNSRASEIINDLLYTGRKELVAVLVSEGAASVEREIGDRISATLKSDQQQLARETKNMGLLQGWLYRRRHRTKNRVTVIVREGETYSTKQLNDISISQAKTVILLTKDLQNDLCRFGNLERREELEKGNPNTIKTLVQVAQMTADEASADDQIIIVEVEDSWTSKIVNKIIEHKAMGTQKCHIIPVEVNKILGQILSQFSIMPELNTVYSELFSNRGSEFFFKPHPMTASVDDEMESYMMNHQYAIPLTLMETSSGPCAYYVANSLDDCLRKAEPQALTLKVDVNTKYHLRPRNVVIVGHNSKCAEIMNGFKAFYGEHKLPDREMLTITVIDDQKSLDRFNNYCEEPYKYEFTVITKPADVYNKEEICAAIEEAIDNHEGDTSILILSDDSAATEDIDSAALTYLIYVQDIIFDRIRKNPDFDRESIDVVVEILNPKNYDVVHNYSVDNVVISNRYISKMVTQIGRKQELFEFYSDILTYDEEDAESFKSKELYIKEVEGAEEMEGFFPQGKIPGPCSAGELVRAVFHASPVDNKAIVLGYCSPGGSMKIFAGNLNELRVTLTKKDKLIVFSNH